MFVIEYILSLFDVLLEFMAALPVDLEVAHILGQQFDIGLVFFILDSSLLQLRLCGMQFTDDFLALTL